MGFRKKNIVFKKYQSAINIYLDDVDDDDKDEVAGMLRGLMCAIEGWGIIKGYTNEFFKENNPVKVWFSSVKNAERFKMCIDYYFDDDILESLKAKKIYKKVKVRG